MTIPSDQRHKLPLKIYLTSAFGGVTLIADCWVWNKIFPTMKKIIMIIFVLVVVLNLQAQNKIILSELNIDQLNLYKEKATKLRNTGMILTLVGAPVFIISYRLLAYYERPNPGGQGNEAIAATYSVLVCGGCSSTLAGIPLWIIGGVKKSRAEIALKKFDIKPDNSMALGVGITLRF